jgi:hypothetical protein
MAKSAVIKLTTAGTGTGPFNLYSNVDSYVTPFETNISKASLLSGYTTNLIPDAAIVIRVKSNNANCTNYIDLVYPGFTTTTTTTTTSTTSTTTTVPPTTTTTTTTTSTTTTTTTKNCTSYSYTYTTVPNDLYVRYSDCETAEILTVLVNTLPTMDNIDGTYTATICVRNNESYSIPICVQNLIEIVCPNGNTWVQGSNC